MKKFNQVYFEILRKLDNYLNEKISKARSKFNNQINPKYKYVNSHQLSLEDFDRIDDIKELIKFHNYLENKISQKAIKLNNGIHPKHRIMNYHTFFLDNTDENSKILDIGCGRGELTYDLAKKAKQVIAIDISRNKINEAKKKFNRDNIKYINDDATKYNFKEKFDFVVLSNILEHIKDRHDFLTKIKHLAKIFLIRVPMINRSWLSIYEKELGLEYRLDKEHQIEYTFETFQKEMESVGLKIMSYSIQFGEIWARIVSK